MKEIMHKSTIMHNESTSEEHHSTIKDAYKAKIRAWCLKTTSHGLPHIFLTTNWLIRLMWFLFFVASLGYCVYIIVITTIKYSKFMTQISFGITDELPAVFPAVTICNVNAFNEKRARTYLQNTTQAQILAAYQCIQETNTTAFLRCLNSTDSTNSVLDTLVDNLKRYVANDRALDTNRSNYGYDLDSEMLVSCLYNSKPCGSANFTRFWDNEYGNCYTFNDGKTGEVVKIANTGSQYGLKMELVVNPPNQESIFSYTNGLHIMIHNKSQLPFTLTSAINVPTGFETYIGVSRTRRIMLAEPYTNCLSNLDHPFSTYSTRLFGYFKELGVNYYDRDFCYTLCYQDQLYDQCSCISSLTPRILNASFCVDADSFCMFDFMERFYTSDINALCEYACRKQCDKIEYNTVSSIAQYPTLSYLRFLATNRFTRSYFPSTNLEDFARKSLLKVIINYDKLYYTDIRDDPDQLFEDYLASLGGQLGLFIGISFLSLLELVELSIELIIVCLRYKKDNDDDDD